MITHDYRLPKSPVRRPGTFPLPPPPSDWYALKRDVESSVTALSAAIAAKQDSLVSGVNLKTVFGQSLLGPGNVSPDLAVTWDSVKDKPELVHEVKVNGEKVPPDPSHAVSISIPEQVNADWNATSGKAEILNRPDLSLKRDLSDLRYSEPYAKADYLYSFELMVQAIAAVFVECREDGRDWRNRLKPARSSVEGFAGCWICAESDRAPSLGWTFFYVSAERGGGFRITIFDHGAQTGTFASFPDNLQDVPHPIRLGNYTLYLYAEYDELALKSEIPEVKPQVQADWAQADGTKPDFVRNKPDLSLKRDLSDLSVREYGPGHGSFALHVDDSSDLLAWADGIWAGNVELTGLDYWVDVQGQWPSVRLMYGFDCTSVCEFVAADGVEGDFQVLDPGTMMPVTRHFRVEPYVPDVDALARVSQVPPEQVNADWNATSGKAAILNKPDVALKRDLTDNRCAVDSWGGEFRIIGEPPQSWGQNYRLVAVDEKTALLHIDGAVVAEYAVSQDLRYAEFKGGNMAYEPFRNFERTEVDAKATESFLTRSGLPKPDWNQTDESAADYVRNKPDLSLKRDRTDNVAHSDSAYWTGPDPDGNEVEFKWTPMPNDYGFDCWDGGGFFLFEKGHGGDRSYLIGRDWTGEADVSIQSFPGSSFSLGPATRRLVAKSGESYVTPSYVKDTAYGKGKREDGSPVDQELHGFFTGSNGLLTGTIKSEGTAPDAHLEAPTDERLKLVLADNTVAYDSAKALPYKLASTIGDRVIASLTLNAASTDITLPTIAANDTTVKDFILDVTNAYSVEGVATDAGINVPRTDVKLVTRDGESLSDVTTVKAGKSAFLRFTQKSPVVVGGVTYPCWFVVKVELGEPS